MALTLDDLTLGEIDTIESLSGISMDQFGEDGVPQGKMLAAIAYVAKRRDNPEFTWNEALGLKPSELEHIFEYEASPNLPVPQDHKPKQPRKRTAKD